MDGLCSGNNIEREKPVADRICSLCGESYTDEKRHNYDICVSRCNDQLVRAKIDAHKAIDHLISAYDHYREAVHIQKQDWWKEKK